MPSLKTKKSPSLEERLNPLKKLIKKSREKTRPATPQEKKEIFDYLDTQLKSLDLAGKVVSLLVYDTARGQINCYGKRIDGGVIFHGLNLTVGTHGSRLTGTVAYPQLPHLTSYHQGYFVSGRVFHAQNFFLPPASYVALVNIPCEPDSNAVKYPKTSPFPKTSFPKP